MPQNSFQKLSTSKLSNVDSLIPSDFVPTSAGIKIKTGYTKVRFEAYPFSFSPGTGWLIERSTDSGSTYSNYASGNGTYINYLAQGLTTGTRYDWRLYLQNKVGNVTYSNTPLQVRTDTRVNLVATGGQQSGYDSSSAVAAYFSAGQRVLAYTNSANFVVTKTGSPDEFIHFLLIGGGGGGGGDYGGGGGGGGMSHITGIKITATGTYSVIVGAGGGESSSYGAGNRGGSSSFLNYTGYGGGGGGDGDIGSDGLTGGCGGGGGFRDTSSRNAGGSGLSGANVTGLAFAHTGTGGFSNVNNVIKLWSGSDDFQGFNGNHSHSYDGYKVGGGGGSIMTGRYTGTNQTLSTYGGSGMPLSNPFQGILGYTIQRETGKKLYYYGWLDTFSNSSSDFSCGGGGGGDNFGNGGVDGGGNGSSNFGQTFYAYPAGLGDSAYFYGCGGGGGGQHGGRGGKGYSGLVLICYFTGENSGF